MAICLKRTSREIAILFIKIDLFWRYPFKILLDKEKVRDIFFKLLIFKYLLCKNKAFNAHQISPFCENIHPFFCDIPHWTYLFCNSIHSIHSFCNSTQSINLATFEENRVSHSKEWKVILLGWGYVFRFLLIFWILHVFEIGPIMPDS